jgi:hypothetical protein
VSKVVRADHLQLTEKEEKSKSHRHTDANVQRTHTRAAVSFFFY